MTDKETDITTIEQQPVEMQTVTIGNSIKIIFDNTNYYDRRFIGKMIKKYTYKHQGSPKKEFHKDHEKIIVDIVDKLNKSFIYPSPERVMNILKTQHKITQYGRVCLTRKLKEMKLETVDQPKQDKLVLDI